MPSEFQSDFASKPSFYPPRKLGTTRDMELVYCNVRLLRDHGAERKASNDVEHAKKTIDKLQQQVSQIEVGCGFSKSERDSNFSVTEDDLQSKLARMQEMFSSTRSVSIFGLRGDQADDPDLYPIRLSGTVEYIESKNMGSLNMGGLQSAESMIPSPANTNNSDSPPSTSTKLAKRPIPTQRTLASD